MFANLAGKKALVCGASQGIGEAIARVFAQQGCSVALLSRSEEKLKAIVRELPQKNNHRVVVCDLGNRENLKNEISKLISEWGPIEILICNTGGPKPGAMDEAQDEDFLSAFQNHVLVNSLLAKLLLPGMKAKNYGRIINIISTSVKVPIPNLGVSNTIRAAVASWAKTLSLEVGSFGITVNNILPGYTKTPRLESLLKNSAQSAHKAEKEIEDSWKAQIPLRRIGDPMEIANAATFLASPEASYISGINLPVDGGRTGCL